MDGHFKSIHKIGVVNTCGNKFDFKVIFIVYLTLLYLRSGNVQVN